jgi:hypothetical protein
MVNHSIFYPLHSCQRGVGLQNRRKRLAAFTADVVVQQAVTGK